MSDHTNPSQPPIKQEQPIDTKGAALASSSAASPVPASVVSEEERRRRNEEAVNTLLASRIDEDDDVALTSPVVASGMSHAHLSGLSSEVGGRRENTIIPPSNSTKYDIGYVGPMPLRLLDCATQKELPWAPTPYPSSSSEAIALMNSMRLNGQKDLLVVYPLENEKFRVAEGRNRKHRADELNWRDINVRVVTRDRAHSLAKASYVNRDLNQVAKAIFIYQMAELVTGKMCVGKTKQEVVSSQLERDYGWSTGFGSKNVQKYIECGSYFAKFPDLAEDTEFMSCGTINALNQAVKDHKEGTEKSTSNNPNDRRKGFAATINRSASAMLSKISESANEIKATPLCAYHLMCVHQAVSNLMADQAFIDAATKGQSEYDAKPKKAKNQ